MPGVRNKVLMGLGGVAGISLAAWRTYFPWIKYDLEMMSYAKTMGKKLESDVANFRFIIDMFEGNVEARGKQPMIIFEDRIYSWEFMNEQANKVANIALKWGLKLGDTVALFCSNNPAFIWTFLGLQKIGIGVAFINYHIRNKPLLHSIRVSEAKAVIVGPGEELFQGFDEIRTHLDIPVYLSGVSGTNTPPGYQSWDDLMFYSSPASICKNVRENVDMLSPCCYIYTSGTTGLPKPAILNQAKAIGYSKFLQFTGVTTEDVVYTTTPLYHSAAVLALFSVIDVGSAMLLKPRFSASHYWEDIRRHKVTITQYIGELCRYLLHQPESPNDGVHNLKAAIGNGLRLDIWEKFQKRFKIPKIYEFFGATEGTSATINVNGRVGSCGRLSPFVRLVDPVKKYLIRYDPATEQPYRTKEGRCVQCKTDEPGLLIAEIPDTYVHGFYKGGKEVNEKKIIRNAFREGDQFFNYGDLLYYDKDYFVYFKDRVGDTFRWKGENVSTNEVANILTGLDFIQDANVYGVEIPGNDGRAGMAAILLKENWKLSPDMLKEIYHYCEENLPTYARPLFLRFIKEMPLTTTFKQKKTEYTKESFDPNMISDPLFHISPERKTYETITSEILPQFLKSRL